MNNEIVVFIPKGGAKLSLSPFDSDYWGNLLVMEQVVGTLVKYNAVNDYEGELASSWITKENELIWEFELKKGLVDELGNPINAESYVRSIKRQLKTYSKVYTPPTFNQLVGWNEFLKGDNSKLGIISTVSNKVIFNFSSKPSGVLEFLSMPYYGYFSDKNFSKDNQWLNNKKIVSSGNFSVSDFNDHGLVLYPRLNKFKYKAKVIIKRGEYQDFLNAKGMKLIAIRDVTIEQSNNDSKIINTTPTHLESIVISNFIKPFDNYEIRKAFKTLVKYEIQKQLKDNTKYLNGLYHSFKEDKVNENEFTSSLKLLKKIEKQTIKTFTYDNRGTDRDRLLREIIDNVILTLSWTNEYINSDSIGENWQEKLHGNKLAEIRIARVDTGTNPEPWVIDMMFCSNLGISFPDPESQICKLVKDYKSNLISILDFENKLSELVVNQSCIIPVKHKGFQWIISKEIPDNIISPTMTIPRLDRVLEEYLK